MATALTEKRVLEIWQGHLQSSTEFRTEENETVRIVYPGRPNDDRGADFKDAVIATRRGLLEGDIEIHRQTSHWWEHGHHRDANYNRVILHVVYRNDSQKRIVLQNGASAPTLALQDYTKSSHDPALSSTPCRSIPHRANITWLAETLDAAGEQRFLERAICFREAVIKSGAGQALYRGMMSALGYSKNKKPMEELADLLPLKQLETASCSHLINQEYLVRCQALLLGTSGLLPSQQGKDTMPGEWVDTLEKTWVSSGKHPEISLSDWRFFKVRPGNHPARRLAAMSHLLLRYREKGLLAGLEEKLIEAYKKGSHYLEEALLVSPDKYWSCHLDLGIPLAGAAPALLGRERAAEIIINVLLPFMYSRQSNSQNEKALELYHNYGAPPANTLVKHMSQQLGVGKAYISSARRQQGLIHIYQTRCSQGKCGACPMNI